MTKFTMWKKRQKNDLIIISKPHAHLHAMKKTYKASKQSVQNCKRKCTHKTPRVNVDRWKKGWKLAHISCPAKAGATIYQYHNTDNNQLLKRK